jgi:hypothetical protein
MLSTNLTGGWTTADPEALTEALTRRYPRHLLAIRSLNARHSRAMLDALRAAGWLLLPSRQVWLLDDPGRDGLAHRDSRRDEALLRSSCLRCEDIEVMSAADAARIAELYGELYLAKYSRLNPAFTPEFIKHTHDTGMIRYGVFRESSGVIVSAAGAFELGEDMTLPVVGYATAAPPQSGLYRLAMHWGTTLAARRGLRLNMSSGAASFKRNRGASPEIEYTAYCVRHLPALRRAPMRIIQAALDRIAVPLLRRYAL